MHNTQPIVSQDSDFFCSFLALLAGVGGYRLGGAAHQALPVRSGPRAAGCNCFVNFRLAARVEWTSSSVTNKKAACFQH